MNLPGETVGGLLTASRRSACSIVLGANIVKISTLALKQIIVNQYRHSFRINDSSTFLSSELALDSTNGVDCNEHSNYNRRPLHPPLPSHLMT